eukprot:169405-Pyramimonas_sp.AAC.1
MPEVRPALLRRPVELFCNSEIREAFLGVKVSQVKRAEGGPRTFEEIYTEGGEANEADEETEGGQLGGDEAQVLPPPGLELVPEVPAPAPYVCDIEGCGMGFNSRRQLLLHQANSKADGHGKKTLAKILAVSSKCIKCDNFYTTR